MRINVSGRVFETYEQTLTSKPGSIFKLKNVWNYFDPENLEFYFERDPKSFAAIFTYMQCGVLAKPEQVRYYAFIMDMVLFFENNLMIYLYGSISNPVDDKWSKLRKNGLYISSMVLDHLNRILSALRSMRTIVRYFFL